jgi:hypothetical protein
VKEVAVENLLQSSYSIASGVILFSLHINSLVEIPIVTVAGEKEKKERAHKAN